MKPKTFICGCCGEKFESNKPDKLDDIIVCEVCFNETKDEIMFEGLYGENADYEF